MRLRRLAASLQRRPSATIRQGATRISAGAGRLREIYNEAWKENWGFVFTEKEFEFMAKELKQLVMPEFTLIAEVGDEPVGFILWCRISMSPSARSMVA